jgi:clan AA aspartic protease (TIGR02281 family)
MNGKFKYFFSNGDKFEGIVVNDIIDGEGIYETSNGIMKGQLLEVKVDNTSSKIILNGQGERQVGRQIQKGFFVEDLLEGEGYLKYESGSVYQGNFSKGLPNGKGTQTYAAGAFLQGTWLNGKCIDCQSNSSKGSNTIDLIPDNNGGFSVSVNFEGQLTINMMFDTGAHKVLLKKEHFDSLLAEGKIKGESRQASYKDAGGNTNQATIYKIGKLTVGKYVLQDVECAVNQNSSNTPNLFGMSAIRKLGKSIKIDLENNYLQVNQ